MDQDTVDAIKRHFGVVTEALHDDIRAVAEGQSLLVEGQARLERRLDGFEARVNLEFQRHNVEF